jgi:cytosine/uracil/thiamine/allantoin permease
MSACQLAIFVFGVLLGGIVGNILFDVWLASKKRTNPPQSP